MVGFSSSNNNSSSTKEENGVEHNNNSNNTTQSTSNNPISSFLHRRRTTNSNTNNGTNLSKHGLSSPLVKHSSTTPHKHHGGGNKASNFQGQSFEPDESEVWRAHVAYHHYSHRGKWLSPVRRREVKRWLLTLVVGVVQSILLLLCNMLIRVLTRTKFNVVGAMMHPNEDVRWENKDDDLLAVKIDDRIDDTVIGDHSYDKQFYAFIGYPFFSYIFFQLLYTLISTLFVWIEPAAGGSGITEIKCLLNGINMPGLVELKTLVCKVVGVCFSVSSGLPIGKEGPMFHSGAIVAAVISQGQFSFRGVQTSIAQLSDFRNPWEKRDFIACGAAAGIASAFSAPIGGVLLSLEEGSSFWSTKLTWRAFFCAMISLLTLLLIKSKAFGKEDIEKLFNFGEFNKSRKGEASFAIWELLIFMAMGCIGGCLGALFNQASEYLTKWRMRNVNHSKYLRSLEALCVSIIVSFVFYFVPYLYGTCTKLPTADETKYWSDQEKHLITALVPFKCQAGKEYNQVASLIFTDADTTIKQLLHFRDDTPHGFTTGALFLYFITYFLMATLAFGIAVPAGLFIPALLSGAGFGRFCGHVLHLLGPGKFANEGIYALIGSAAMLGGKARMTISLTVILLEASGDMEFVLPLMFTLMCARFTGNLFNEGIYELGIHLKHIPFLEPEIPKIVDKQEMTVSQAMSTDVKVVRLVERAGVVYDLLKSYPHSTFPIVDMSTSRILYGTVSRDVLCTLLLRKAFGDFDDPGIAIGPKRLSPLVQWATIQRAYPKYPTIEDVDISPIERNRVLDLRPYANSAPYTIHETASIQRTYTLFRTLGLRFLCVVDNNNQVVGMVTRKDLLADALEESLMKGKFEDKIPVDHVVS